MPSSARQQIATIIDRFEWDGKTSFSDDPDDRGAETNYGVTRALLSAHLGLKAGALCDVATLRALTHEEAITVGTEEIALKSGLYRITNDRLRFAALDFGFHSGPPLAIRALQRAVGAHADGIFGPQTEAVVNRADASATRERLIAARLELMGGLISRDRRQAKFAKDWLWRVGQVLCAEAA